MSTPTITLPLVPFGGPDGMEFRAELSAPELRVALGQDRKKVAERLAAGDFPHATRTSESKGAHWRIPACCVLAAAHGHRCTGDRP